MRVAYLNQLIVDLNAQTDATFLIVTHDIGTARTVPDNLGMLFRRELVMFGPREVLLTSEEPVVKQFLNGRREGPIGMSEEKDSARSPPSSPPRGRRPAPRRHRPEGRVGSGVPPQLQPSPGLPERKAVARRQERVLDMLHTLPEEAQQAIKRLDGRRANANESRREHQSERRAAPRGAAATTAGQSDDAQTKTRERSGG